MIHFDRLMLAYNYITKLRTLYNDAANIGTDVASDDEVIDEFKRIWKEGFLAWSRHYRIICLELLRKSTKTLVGIAGTPAGIRTENLPNTNLERYIYTNLINLLNTFSAKWIDMVGDVG
jgi:hypothetical protein